MTSEIRDLQPSLSDTLPRIILGGAAFSTQIQASPHDLPAVSILRKAFDSGITAIDTSPYYGPSEVILGEALKHPEITSNYPRHTYFVATKVGRIATNTFDYSKDWVRYSVKRSLKRLGGSSGDTDPYLDLVYCHDIEFVSEDEMCEALEVLFEFQKEGKVRYVGISSYSPQLLLERVKAIKARLGKTVDAVQNYCHLNLQNSKLERFYPQIQAELGKSGVVISSSPLGMGLLRRGGAFGDWHPAPKGLQEACSVRLAKWCEEEKGEKLANLALKYSVGKMALLARDTGGHTIMGPSLPEELEENLHVLGDIMAGSGDGQRQGLRVREIDVAKVEALSGIFEEAREKVGPQWIDYCWESPPADWDQIREVNEEKMVELE